MLRTTLGTADAGWSGETSRLPREWCRGKTCLFLEQSARTELLLKVRVQATGTAQIRAIDRAIGEIKKASLDDGKNIEDHPPIDAHMKRTDRFHNAERLLHKVQSRRLRDRALFHVDKAWHQVQDAINAGLQ